MFYVYQYIDPRNDLPFYIGKGTNDRKLDHLKETVESTINIRKYNKIQSIKTDGYEPIIQEIAIFENEEDAYALENQLIQKYGRKGIEENGILMNLTLGSNPPSHKGKKWWNNGITQKLSIECPGQDWKLGTLKKGTTWWTNGVDDVLSSESPGKEWQTGRQKTKENIPWNKGVKGAQVPWNKGKKGIKGHKCSEENKKLYRELYKGKTRTNNDKEKMKEGWKKVKENGYIPWNKGKTCKTPTNVKSCYFISPDGVEYKYPSMRQGCLVHKLAICKMSNVRTGKLTNYKGWTIRVDE